MSVSMKNSEVISVVCALCCLFISSSTAGGRYVIRQVTEEEGQITYDDALKPHLSNSGDIRAVRNEPPSSHIVKIEKFSKINASRSPWAYYESTDFVAGELKWQLVFYPNGNIDDGGEDHISLYVKIDQSHISSHDQEVVADLKLFVLNHKQNNYLMVLDTAPKRFNQENPSSGFSQFLSLSVLNDTKNGYLVDDSLTIGAEISLIKPAEKTETLSFIENPPDDIFRWQIDLSKTDGCAQSLGLPVGPRNWEFTFCPKGSRSQAGKSPSVWVNGMSFLEDAVRARTFARYEVKLLNQINSSVKFVQGYNWFNVYPYVGYLTDEIISLKDLNDPSNGYLVDDQIIMEFDIPTVSVTKLVNN